MNIKPVTKSRLKQESHKESESCEDIDTNNINKYYNLFSNIGWTRILNPSQQSYDHFEYIYLTSANKPNELRPAELKWAKHLQEK